MTQVIFVYVTCPDETVAKQIAKKCIEKRFAACANILPNMSSMYWWDGVVKEESEVVLILKAKKSNFHDLRVLITQSHPYDIPCILSWDITAGNQPYLDWIKS